MSSCLLLVFRAWLLLLRGRRDESLPAAQWALVASALTRGVRQRIRAVPQWYAVRCMHGNNPVRVVGGSISCVV